MLLFTRVLISLLILAAPLHSIWEPSESLKLKIVGDVQLSPDNSTVAVSYSEAVMSDTDDRFASRLFLYKKGESPIEIIANNPMQPRWSPDGRWIAFVAKEKNNQVLYIRSINGNKPIKLTDVKLPVQTFRWSPDSKSIAFVMAELLPKKSPKQIAIVYKEDLHINRLWMIDIAKPGEPKPITPNSHYFVRGYSDWGTANEEFDWSPDGQKIVFAYTKGAGLDNMFMDSSIAVIDLKTMKIDPWEKKVQVESQPFFSPDGKKVAYLISEPESNYFCNRYLAIRDVDGSNVIELAPTFNEGPLLAGPNLLGWSNDQSSLLFFEPYQTRYRLVKVPVNGSPASFIETGNRFFKQPSLSHDRTKLGFIAQDSSTPPEAFIAEIDHFIPAQVTKLNERFKQKPVPKTEIIRWKSKDGLEIEGMLTYPLKYTPGKQYPLLLNIHGGPMFVFDETYVGSYTHLYLHAAFAEAGIATLRPNPRGSTGYGREFREANYGDWCGKDYEDVIAGVDFLTAQGLADPNRLGICGWSYGGYMTAWAVTQTDRFKAASIGAALFNMVSFANTTDLDRFIPAYFGDFFESMETYRLRSPLTYAAKVKTPCIIQHGMNDQRVPVSQAYELYNSFNKKEKIATLELYPNMEHGPRTPKMILEIMERNLEWFKGHLDGSF